MQVTMTVNGDEVTREVEPRLLLVHFVRDHLGLTGTHWGCDTSNCGTCVLWMDGEPVKSCTVLAAMADGREVRTVEGLERDGELDPRAAGLHAVPRPAVRLLHPGDDDDGPLAARPRPRPERGQDPRGDLRPVLPVHRLREHRALGPLGGRAPRAAQRPRRCRHDAPTEVVPASDGRQPHRLRPHAPQGGRPLPARPGQLPRRHPAARHAARRHPAQPVRPRPHRLDRHLGRRGPPEGQGGHHRRHARDPRAWPGCRPCRTTSRPCWPPTRCGSRARRSRSSSPRTATRPATRSS